MIDWPAIAAEIKRRRTAGGWTQEELADELGVHLPTVGRLEIGNRRPSFEMLEKLAVVFGCTVRDLIIERKSARSTGTRRRRAPK